MLRRALIAIGADTNGGQLPEHLFGVDLLVDPGRLRERLQRNQVRIVAAIELSVIITASNKRKKRAAGIMGNISP